MTEFKGTKGEWRVAYDLTQVTTSKKGILEGSKKICHMATFCKTEEEVKANAKLIAAAPKLLNALIELVDCNNSSGDLGLRGIDAMADALSVIKEATE